MRLLPKRLPQSSAETLRKSARSAPQYEAVGRNPTSFASAPRSPTWFAIRSSSSPTPRSAIARAAGFAPASASTAFA